MFILVIVPITAALLIAWGITKEKKLLLVLGVIWGGLIGLFFLSIISQTIFAKKILKKSDYYGEYIIDRNYFKGKQADWQYNSFNFEIKDNDSIYFYSMNEGKTIKIFKGIISTSKIYTSEILILKMEQPTHHVISGNPTIYRKTWDFFLVFNSPKFNNMYFKKGKWQPIEK